MCTVQHHPKGHGLWLCLQPVDEETSTRLGLLGDSSTPPPYIAASYIKWIEMAGGRPVPIFHNADHKQLKAMYACTEVGIQLLCLQATSVDDLGLYHSNAGSQRSMGS